MPAQSGSVHQHQLRSFESELADRYRIERELGRGGMATVYLAHDLKHDRPVALKVLRPEIASVLGTERFLREIRIAARLSHHNILPLYDSAAAADMLFYVMPFVEGGTLMERLASGPRPSLAEALGITRQIAEGLAYAHMFDVIHRDIKPANILLASGHVFIADFGIARAIRRATTQDGITSSGFVLGTPSYMAPEQLTGAEQVDGRADEYSLACVLYEMLVGHPPSRGKQGPASIRRAVTEAMPEAPASVVVAMEKALSAEPSERFPGAAEFAAALDATVAEDMPPLGESGGRASLVSKAMALGVGATILLLALWAIIGPGRRSPATSDVVLDTARYAVLPFETGEGVDVTVNEDQFLRDALGGWSGLSVVDRFQVRDALERTGKTLLTSADAERIAGHLGAGRYIRGSVSRTGDSIRVHASLYDTPSGGVMLTDASASLAPSLEGAESVFRRLVIQLLFRDSPPAEHPDFVGTRSLPARQAYIRGQRAIEAWDLEAADTAFAEASRVDPEYAQAWLWLALVRAWAGGDPATWKYAAERAVSGKDNLSGRDRAIAEVIRAQASEDFAYACPQWEALTDREPGDFVSWYGSAVCQASDRTVLPDPGSPSGFRFQSSYHSALQAYQRAFELLPAILTTLRSRSYEPIRDLLSTSRTSLRGGRELGADTLGYVAYPSWQHDTLAFVPYEWGRIAGMEVAGLGADIAVQHQLELFHTIAVTWATAYPRNPDALEALAVSLELLGDRGALDTIRRARELTTGGPDRDRIAATQVRIQLRFSIPDDTAGMRAATALADTLLKRGRAGEVANPDVLVSLAAFTGRAADAAILNRRAAGLDGWTMAPPLRTYAPALLIFSAFGGPADSLTRLEDEVARAIDQVLPVSSRDGLRDLYLVRPATIAFPVHRSERLQALASADYYLLKAELAYLRHDSAAVRTILSHVQSLREGRVIDVLYPEAWLRSGIGDDKAAIAWLDPVLKSLPTAPLETFSDPVKVTTLVRAMAVRAKALNRLGKDEEAARWAGAVAILWKGADTFLTPFVTDMSRIAWERP